MPVTYVSLVEVMLVVLPFCFVLVLHFRFGTLIRFNIVRVLKGDSFLHSLLQSPLL